MIKKTLHGLYKLSLGIFRFHDYLSEIYNKNPISFHGLVMAIFVYSGISFFIYEAIEKGVNSISGAWIFLGAMLIHTVTRHILKKPDERFTFSALLILPILTSLGTVLFVFHKVQLFVSYITMLVLLQDLIEALLIPAGMIAALLLVELISRSIVNFFTREINELNGTKEKRQEAPKDPLETLIKTREIAKNALVDFSEIATNDNEKLRRSGYQIALTEIITESNKAMIDDSLVGELINKAINTEQEEANKWQEHAGNFGFDEDYQEYKKRKTLIS